MFRIAVRGCNVGVDSGDCLLGDASGKGVAAGLVASAVQARVNTAARLAHLDPAELMAAVDRDVYAHDRRRAIRDGDLRRARCGVVDN